MDFSNLQTIKNLLSTNQIWAKKFMGQNFLVNADTLAKIVETADIQPTDLIIEVGSGFGVLTQKLLEKARKVTTIELDRALVELLKTNFAELENFKNLEIIHHNALKFTPPSKPYKVVANVPYNISSPLINHFLQADNPPTSLTLLLQKEVVQKICTLEPDMSVLSLQIALFGQAKFIKKISCGHFYPAPKVDSAILKIEIYQPTNPNFTDRETAIKALNLAKKAFSQKRKKLSNTLADLKTLLPEIGIDPSRRPETLSVKEWLKAATLTPPEITL